MRISNDTGRPVTANRTRRGAARGGGGFREVLERAGDAAKGTAATGRSTVAVTGRGAAAGRPDGSPRRPEERRKGAAPADPVERLLARLVAPPSADARGAGRGDGGDGGAPGGGGPGGGQGSGDGHGGGPAGRDEASGEAGGRPGPGGTPLLASAVARIALLVNAGAAPAISLQLGRSVEVRVAQADAGVEVTLCPARGLSPMAEAELPLLVAALRARGVRVVRAGVRRGDAGGSAAGVGAAAGDGAAARR